MPLPSEHLQVCTRVPTITLRAAWGATIFDYALLPPYPDGLLWQLGVLSALQRGRGFTGALHVI
jgi:hypothetical protein